MAIHVRRQIECECGSRGFEIWPGKPSGVKCACCGKMVSLDTLLRLIDHSNEAGGTQLPGDIEARRVVKPLF